MGPDGADTVASLDVRSGDPAIVFASLFDAHASGLHRYLSRRVGAVADDLVAETFMAGMANREGYDPSKADPRAWLYGIATHLLRRHFRQELRGLVATAKAAAAVSINGSDPGDEVSDQVDAGGTTGAIGCQTAVDAADQGSIMLWRDPDGTEWMVLIPDTASATIDRGTLIAAGDGVIGIRPAAPADGIAVTLQFADGHTSALALSVPN